MVERKPAVEVEASPKRELGVGHMVCTLEGGREAEEPLLEERVDDACLADEMVVDAHRCNLSCGCDPSDREGIGPLVLEQQSG